LERKRGYYPGGVLKNLIIRSISPKNELLRGRQETGEKNKKKKTGGVYRGGEMGTTYHTTSEGGGWGGAAGYLKREPQGKFFMKDRGSSQKTF